MRLLLPIFLLVLFFASCSTSKDSNLYKNQFSPSELALIKSGKSTDPMRVLLIVNPKDSVILRTKSQPVYINPKDKIMQHFVDRLYYTVRDSATMGVGIAAPQVGILKRIIWVQRLDKEGEPFEAYFNPEIIKYSDLKQDVPEGCLSIPDFRATTKDRAYAIFLTYKNREGLEKCEMIEAFTAAIFQHEIDHLEGIMFTDHLENEREGAMNHKY